ncbi:MAG: phosphoribosylformylglycinamidine synthase subunit PurQ [Phycisphaeraceae bacterium]|nr:phosphoribosylformylglycinamidine synthase subunit PurQ [Phycisphaeraceae bacterium]
MQPLTLILRTAGTNCDRELAHAFELAGAATQTLHLNELIKDPARIDRFDLIGFPGGFSYGDDIAAGRIFANRLRHHLYEPLKGAIARGVPMIGVCNGFQVLAKLGLLPEPEGAGNGRQAVTLADNACGRFIDRWVKLEAQADSVCVWTRGLSSLELPIAHGEGRFVPESDAVLERIKQNRQIALRYAADDNPNGSTDNIAGVCDPTGLVLGLMPHPERFIHPTNHPQWTRQSAQWMSETPAGLRFFQNAVERVASKATLAVG